jgi:hypothetical protein
MSIRVVLIAGLTLAAVANAQSGRGRGVPGGPGPGARFVGAEVGMPGRVVKNAPFSADIVTETTQVLQDGSRIKQSSTVRYYRDSEGRTRREQSLQNLGGLAPGSSLPQVAFINDPVAGAAYALNLDKRTFTKTGRIGARSGGSGASEGAGPMPRMSRGPGGSPEGEARPAVRTRGSQNVKTESLGRQLIEGVPADGTRTTMTIPAGAIGNENALQVVNESWYSPELQAYVLRKRSDPRSGESVTRYTNVVRADPARTMFEPPADFKANEMRGPRARQ